MPTGRGGAEKRVVHPEPQKKKRSIVISHAVGIDCRPHVRRKILGCVMPVLYSGVLQNLGYVVVHESEGERAKISDGGDRTRDDLHKSGDSSRTREPGKLGISGCKIAVHVYPGSNVVRAGAKRGFE